MENRTYVIRYNSTTVGLKNAFIVKKKKGGLNHDQDLAHVVHPDDDLMQEVNSVMSVDKKNMS